MTFQLALYGALTTLLEPAAPLLVQRRVKAGKEQPDRIPERYGRASIARPSGELLWMHAASVGESRLLLDLFAELRRRRAGLQAVLTTQTLTSAELIARAAAPGVIHQMAPMDGPGAVKRFLDHWRPDAAVFAEGEIWPNMLGALRRRRIPAALVNARMTARSLDNWNSRRASARELFDTFSVIAAADRATADGLAKATGRAIDIVGNLKLAAPVALASPETIAQWRGALGSRPVLVAASTHPGEDAFVFEAFAPVLEKHPSALLILAPRHPDRGPAIAELARRCGYKAQLRSSDAALPQPRVNMLVADTLGELMLWFALADGVYLGGATAPDIGGHNAIEPVAAGRRVATGPHGFNFREVFDELHAAGHLVFVDAAPDLTTFWLASLSPATAPHAPIHTPTKSSFDPTTSLPNPAAIRPLTTTFEATVSAVLSLLNKDLAHA